MVMKMYGDDEQYREEFQTAKKQWLTANNLYKQLLHERSCITGDRVVEEPSQAPSSQFQHSSLKSSAQRPKKRRRVVNDDSDSELPASSSSNVLEDGLYCLPLTDKPLSLDVAAALLNAQEEDNEENADDEEFLFT